MDGENVQAYVGVFMRLRLIQLLGIPKAWRVANVVIQAMNGPSFDIERRSLLKRSGVMAGLAVLGIRGFQIEFDHSGHGLGDSPQPLVGGLTHRRLTGAELQSVLQEAERDDNALKLIGFVSGSGHTRRNDQAMGIMVEIDGKPPLVSVTIPFVNSIDNTRAEVRYMRLSSRTITSAGVIRSTGQTSLAVDAFEVVSGSPRHVATYRRREDGSVVKKEMGQNAAPETVVMESDDLTIHGDCENCMEICTKIVNIGCGLGGVAVCGIVCAAVSGPVAPFCPYLCALFFMLICDDYSDLQCGAFCKTINYC